MVMDFKQWHFHDILTLVFKFEYFLEDAVAVEDIAIVELDYSLF